MDSLCHLGRFSTCNLLTILLLVTSLQPPVLSLASLSTFPKCKFPAIFNFGDSNSDTGGLSATFGQPPPPYGETFFHSPAGRFSDGRLMIDFMAESLGLPYLSAYLDSLGSNFRHGANFATAGSTILPQNETIFQSGYSPISLDVQLIQYSNFHERSRMLITKRDGGFESALPGGSDFSRALYALDIGQNDFTAAYEINHNTTKQVKALVIPDLLVRISDFITHLYAQGGRRFWIHNTGPVGCYPYVMVRLPVAADQVDKYGCASPYNEVAHNFNLGLKETVKKLRKDLPLAAITYVDIYSAKYYLITRARELGFEKPFVACCGHGGKLNYSRFNHCGKKKVVSGKEIVVAKSCRDPSKRISWDGIHFTEAANKWIFDRIVNGSFSDPPVPLTRAC